MSLLDGTSKMSKSAEAEGSRINLMDSADEISKKIKRCKTDSFDGLEYDNPERPESNNLLSIYQLMSGKTKEEVAAECASMRWGDFKPVLTDACVAHLEPIQARYNEALGDKAYLDGVLKKGAETANESAEWTLNNVKQAMGFMPRL
jgi:tryptophanyl-tRNA synthetase